MERWREIFLSALPLSCLIFDHRLWPDCAADVVENCRHREHINSPLGPKARMPLENVAIVIHERKSSDTKLCLLHESPMSKSKLSNKVNPMIAPEPLIGHLKKGEIIALSKVRISKLLNTVKFSLNTLEIYTSLYPPKQTCQCPPHQSQTLRMAPTNPPPESNIHQPPSSTSRSYNLYLQNSKISTSCPSSLSSQNMSRVSRPTIARHSNYISSASFCKY